MPLGFLKVNTVSQVSSCKNSMKFPKEIQTFDCEIYLLSLQTCIFVIFASFAENGSEDIDILPSGLAFISSVSVFHTPQQLMSICV